MSSNQSRGRLFRGFWGGYLVLILVLVTLAWQVETSLPEPLMVREIQRLTQTPSATTLRLMGEGFNRKVKVVVAADPQPEELVQQRFLPEVNVQRFARGDQLFVASCELDRLVVMKNLPSGGLSLPIGSVVLPERISAVHIVEDMAVVGLVKQGGVMLVDLTDPTHPRIDRHLQMNGTPFDFVSVGKMVYAANFSLGLVRINLAARNPQAEILAPLDRAWRLSLHEDKLVVGAIGGTVAMFSLGSRDQVDEVGRLKFSRQVRGVAVTSSQLIVAFGDGVLHGYRFDRWPDVWRVAEIMLPGKPFHMVFEPEQQLAVLSQIGAGLIIVELTEGHNARVVSRILQPRRYMEHRIYNGLIYAAGEVGLEVFSLDRVVSSSNPVLSVLPRDFVLPTPERDSCAAHNEKLLGHTRLSPDEGYGPDCMKIKNNNQIVVSREGRGAETALHATLLLERPVVATLLREHFVYALTKRGLEVFDLFQPESLQRVAELPLSGEPQLQSWIAPGYLLVTAGSEGLLAVDVRDPGRPSLVGQVELVSQLKSRFSARGLRVHKSGLAYVTFGENGVGVVDIRNPEKMQLISLTATPGEAKDIVFHENLALVADGSAGVYMMEIDDRGELTPIGTLPVPIYAREVEVLNNELYVASAHGIVKMPVPRVAGVWRVVNSREVRVELPNVLSNTPLRVYLYGRGEATEARLPAVTAPEIPQKS